MHRNFSAAIQDFLAGAGIGILVGLLIGLSVSEVVGSVIAGLTALLAAFFGLNLKMSSITGKESPERSPLQTWRIIGFSFLCSAAVLAGVYIRTHNLLGQTPTQSLKAWTDTGFSTEIAREIVAFQKLGVIPKDWEVSPKPGPSPMETVLFFEIAQEDLIRCQNLEKERYASAIERAIAFRQEGGIWQRIGEAIEGIPEEKQEVIMDFFWELICSNDKESPE
jgi:hypothetical protein